MFGTNVASTVAGLPGAVNVPLPLTAGIEEDTGTHALNV